MTSFYDDYFSYWKYRPPPPPDPRQKQVDVTVNGVNKINQALTNLTAFSSINAAHEESSNNVSDTHSIKIIIVSSLVSFLLLFIIIVALIFYWRKRDRRKWRTIRTLANLSRMNTVDGTSVQYSVRSNWPEPIEHEPPELDRWEVPRDRLKMNIDDKLGSGAFSVVYKGILHGEAPVVAIYERVGQVQQSALTNAEVAIKVLPDYADLHSRIDFIQEINFMKELGYHKHLVSLIACITIESPVCLVTEYCEHGDLLHFMRNNRDEIIEDRSDLVNFKHLLSFAWQICDGMSYLASKNCIHRDVAARNVLIDKYLTAKISDFGLCRLLESTLYTSRGGRLPIKWMSIESLMHYEYTEKSDIWSYGVLLWEMYSFGEVPYSWLQPVDMIDHLKAGNRLKKPMHTDDAVFNIMCMCWKEKASERPNFNQLKMRFSRLLETSTEHYGYLDHYNENALDETEAINKNTRKVCTDNKNQSECNG